MRILDKITGLCRKTGAELKGLALPSEAVPVLSTFKPAAGAKRAMLTSRKGKNSPYANRARLVVEMI
jgi:hypothetical protein